MSHIKVLYSEVLIQQRIQEMAAEIAKRFPDEIMIVGLLRGSFVFAADLIRALHPHHVKVQMDFMTLSSYGNETISSGNVIIHRDISEDVQGKHILVIDDILESGRTLSAAVKILKERGASAVTVAVFLEKPGKLVTPIQADIVGFKTADVFVVGYGLDYQNYYRELPYIGVLCDS